MQTLCELQQTNVGHLAVAVPNIDMMAWHSKSSAGVDTSMVGRASKMLVHPLHCCLCYFARIFVLTKQEDSEEDVLLEAHGGCPICRLVRSTSCDDGTDRASLIEVQKDAEAEEDSRHCEDVGRELAIETTDIPLHILSVHIRCTSATDFVRWRIILVATDRRGTHAIELDELAQVEEQKTKHLQQLWHWTRD